ncbi:GNAT family N-acetyltransferase [Enterovirga rhinocerotis]|uniref:Acetyltransferase (GNAT) family protein n=1 Tax=Enterovirga rhinocerotis TaxID=1339210 RepID=A0A4R7C1C4_9HYPH|nr:GNAT family N-acetyltransferase [Enterovirga rhinocerotis]TDR90186.1 acetyltransferase (GNAT) family protein [Enterovirga rhinocerotis]
MDQAALTLELERRLVNAWPSFETELAGGWLLRFTRGYSKRANAATPIVQGASLDAELIEAIGASFAARGLPACFRLTGTQDAAAEGLLDAAGFVSHEPSLALTAPLDAVAAPDSALDITARPSAAWCKAAAAAYGGEKADAEMLARIVSRIRQKAAFATLRLDGEAAAWGFAVAERGLVGLYDIVVAPDLRGLGLGRRLVADLMAWGRQAGAERAYLQMREANETAFALYTSLGYGIAYRYTHRLRAAERRTGDRATTGPASIASRQPPGDEDASA